MAKEWGKFQSDYKKISPSIQKYAFDAAAAYSKRMGIAHTACFQGEQNLSESMVTARKNGVTGTGLNDFIKDKDFKQAIGLLDTQVSMLTEATRDFEAFCKAAAKTADDVGKLHDAIAKDLKSRKDKSVSKKDIEALLQTTLDNQADLIKSSKYYEQRVNKGILGYAGNFQKTVARILKEAPAAQEKSKASTELPMLFVDRNIKKNFSAAVTAGKKVAALCDSALEKAQDDLKAAASDLKAAAAAFKPLKALQEGYDMAMKTQGAALDISKDKAAILKMVAAIEKAHATAERTLRGTATTIKKAG
ncbi:MAG: hypothetical protein ABI832_12575 [bacterium]